MGESSITGPDLIRDTSKKVSLIRQRLLTAQSRQKSYADVRRRPLDFEVGDHMSRPDSQSDPIGGSESGSETRDYILGLFTCFFFSDIGVSKSYDIIKISYTYQKNYHRSGVHQNLYTYTESHLLIHIQKQLYISITYSERRTY